MTAVATPLPLTETFTPASQQELAEVVRRAAAEKTPLYPLGGGTSLTHGITARRSGWGIATTGLEQVIDYPAGDMTITVEAGLTIERLRQILAAEGQRLPIDVPQADRATLGGVIATATSGPRRYAHGTMRDFVIGISAVDGRGVPFKAGGRVVKNVAGYDFCKLLTGSQGSLAVITQVTLKLRPVAETTAIVACDVENFSQAETLLAALGQTATTPAAVELLAGPEWRNDEALGPIDRAVARLVIALEGTAVEVDWMIGQLSQEWRNLAVRQPRVVQDAAATALLDRLVEYPVDGEPALVISASVLPSRVTQLIEKLRSLDEKVSIQSHAGSGAMIARFAEFSTADALPLLIRGVHPAAVQAGGSARVLSCAAGVELTHPAVWGSVPESAALMRAVKSQLDPHGLFNPGLAIFEC